MSKNVKYPQVPLQEILHKCATEFPQKTAIVYGEKEITYAQLELLSNQFANVLIKVGIKKGDRVAIFLPNIPQFIIAYFGILKAGAVVTAISPLLREREVGYQLRDSEAKIIIGLDSLYSVVDNVWAKTKLKNIIVTSLDQELEKARIPGKPNVHGLKQLLKQAEQTPPTVRINSK